MKFCFEIWKKLPGNSEQALRRKKMFEEQHSLNNILRNLELVFWTLWRLIPPYWRIIRGIWERSWHRYQLSGETSYLSDGPWRSPVHVRSVIRSSGWTGGAHLPSKTEPNEYRRRNAQAAAAKCGAAARVRESVVPPHLDSPPGSCCCCLESSPPSSRHST